MCAVLDRHGDDSARGHALARRAEGRDSAPCKFLECRAIKARNLTKKREFRLEDGGLHHDGPLREEQAVG